MKKVLAFLEGKKTYLIATALAVVQLLVENNVLVLSTKQLLLVNSVLVGLGFGALRNAVAKESQPKL